MPSSTASRLGASVANPTTWIRCSFSPLMAAHLIVRKRAEARALLDLKVVPCADLGERVSGDEASFHAPLQHLLGVREDAVGDTGSRFRLLLQQVEPFMQRHLLGGELPDFREDTKVQSPRAAVVAVA